MDNNVAKWRTALRNQRSMREKRPELFQNIGGKKSYLLQGNIDGDIVVVIIEDDGKGLTIARDIPAINEPAQIMNRDEEYTSIRIKVGSFRNLIDFVVKQSGLNLSVTRNKGGRPPKYGPDDAKRIARLYNHEKMSMRQIATKEKMSTATIQKLLKEYETIAIAESLNCPDLQGNRFHS